MDPEYPVGALKRHPNYPETPTVAMRTIFNDDDHTACTSWLTVSGGGLGNQYLTTAQVTDWPDVEVTDVVA